MRDDMAVGDHVLIYHSNQDPVGIVGVGVVVMAAHPDLSERDENSPYYDPRPTPNGPRWWCVDIGFVQKFSHILTLTQLKSDPRLMQLQILQRGNRLSITPILPDDFHYLVKWGDTGET